MDEDRLKIWCNQYLKKNLIYPSIKDLQKQCEKWGYSYTKLELKKFRNSLKAISKYEKIGNRNLKHYIGYRISSLGWVEIDIGFLTYHKKKYGQFYLAVDILSKRVYVESISNKSFKSIQTFLINLKKQPGFSALRRIYSDNESALKSKKNRESLEKLLSIKIFLTTRKASYAERNIRTFKFFLSKLLLAQNKKFTQWRSIIENVLLKINTKQLYASEFRPIDINSKNISKYIEYLIEHKPYYKFHFYKINLPSEQNILNKLFKFNINDHVYLAKKIFPDEKVKSQYWGETRSIAGHFDEKLPSFKIIERKVVLSYKLKIIPLYDIQYIKGYKKLFNIYEFYLRKFPK